MSSTIANGKYSQGQDCHQAEVPNCPETPGPCYFNKVQSTTLKISGECSEDGGTLTINTKEPEPVKCDTVTELMPNDLITVTRNGTCAQITFDDLLKQLQCKRACL